MGMNGEQLLMCICERLFSACRSECEREEGKQRYNVRMQRGIPGNPADMGIPPRPGRHMALSGPLAGDQYRNKHRWIRLSKQSINGDAQKALKNRLRQSWFSIQAPRRGESEAKYEADLSPGNKWCKKKKKKKTLQSGSLIHLCNNANVYAPYLTAES